MSRLKVLFITNHPIEDASCRYRIYQFLPALQQAGFECEVRPFTDPPLFRAIRGQAGLATKVMHTGLCSFRRITDLARLTHYSVVVIHREAFPFFMPAVENIILKMHRKVVFSFDDAIYVGHGDTSSLPYPFLYKFKYGPAVAKVLRESSHVIAANSVLADYARQFNSRVSVVPTVVDLDRYLYQPPQPCNDRPLTIGWFGSDSTSPYLRSIEPALKRLAESNPGRVRFRFYGDPRLRLDLLNFEAVRFSLSSEIDDLRTIDIGIMPLPDSPWTRGKSAFKAIQYMALGIPTVVSPVGMAAELVQHKVNGFLAQSNDDWYSSLSLLLNNFQVRRECAAAARQTIADHYSLQVWAGRFADLLRQVSHN